MKSGFRLWYHARIQMHRRNISQEMVQLAMTDPDSRIVGGYGRYVFQKIIVQDGAGKLLRLVVETGSDGVLEIVTMYLTSNIKRHMGEQ